MYKVTACILDTENCDDIVITFETWFLPPDCEFYFDLDDAVCSKYGDNFTYQLLSWTTE